MDPLGLSVQAIHVLPGCSHLPPLIPIILTGVWSMLTEIYGTACNWPGHRRGPCCAAVESQPPRDNRGAMSQAALLAKYVLVHLRANIQFQSQLDIVLFPSFTKKIISSRHSSTRTSPMRRPATNSQRTRFVASTWLSALKIDGPSLIG